MPATPRSTATPSCGSGWATSSCSCRATFGVFGLADVGRVYLEGESSDVWHTGFGGGLWFAFLERANTMTLSLVSGRRSDRALSPGGVRLLMLLAERRLIGGVIGETPSELSSAPGRPRRLPDDLLRQASQRLEIMALVAAVLWALGPVLEHLAMYLASPEDPRWSQYHTIDNIAIGCVVASLALFVFLRRGTRDPSTVMDLALVYMVAMAFAIGVLIHYGAPSATPPDASLPMITWIGPLILMFAAIVPAAPWKMFVAGLAAASMDSIGMLVGGAMGTYDFGPRAQSAADALPQLSDAGRRGRGLARGHPAGAAGEQGAGAGQLSPGRAARPRRDGRGLPRDASMPGQGAGEPTLHGRGARSSADGNRDRALDRGAGPALVDHRRRCAERGVAAVFTAPRVPGAIVSSSRRSFSQTGHRRRPVGCASIGASLHLHGAGTVED